MESQPQSLEPASPSPPPTSRPVLRSVVVGTVALLLAAALLISLTGREQRVVWLSPTQLAQSTRGGLFAQLKQKLVRLMPAFVWRFWRTKPQVLINCDLERLSEEAVKQTGLGTPVATNASGMRAWVLSPAELSAFRQRLLTIPGVERLSSPRVLTASGGQARVSVGQAAPAAKKAVASSVKVDLKPKPDSNSVIPVVAVTATEAVASPMPVAGSAVQGALTVDLTPKYVSGSIKLVVGVTATEAVTSPSDNYVYLRTNFSAACRVTLQNVGGLVVDGGNAQDAGGTSYWIIICPMLLDSRGNPIKP